MMYNLQCEDKENIYDVTFVALDIDEAYELAKDYLNKYSLYPIGMWECD